MMTAVEGMYGGLSALADFLQVCTSILYPACKDETNASIELSGKSPVILKD
jgi:hypothetical protein